MTKHEHQARQRLRPADPVVVDSLLEKLRHCVLVASDGHNATWCIQQLIHGVESPKAYIAQHRGRFVTTDRQAMAQNSNSEAAA
jgi:hypothetical protein